MNYRTLGSTGMRISEIGFGGWAIGGSWGRVDESDAMGALRAALEWGVNFFDTADVYGDGRSERLIARLRKETGAPFYVATKAGRGINPHTAEAYTSTALRSFVQGSLRNLETDSLDLLPRRDRFVHVRSSPPPGGPIPRNMDWNSRANFSD